MQPLGTLDCHQRHALTTPTVLAASWFDNEMEESAARCFMSAGLNTCGVRVKEAGASVG